MSYKYNYKEESKKDWTSTVPDGATVTHQDLKLGAILRIADATELMAKNFLNLQSENERLKNRLKSTSSYYETEKRRSAKYKGLYHKLKNNPKI